MGKRIWIINQYAGTPKTENPARHYSIATELNKLGYKVVIITASFTHRRSLGFDIKGDFYSEMHNGITYVWISVPTYSNVHGLGRIFNWMLFAHKLKKVGKVIENTPDLLYYSSLSLVGYLGASYLKKKYKIPLYFEVRDIWPLTLKKLKGLSDHHPLVWILNKIEKKALAESDVILSNLTNFQQYLKDTGFDQKPYLWLPNGIDKSLVGDQPLGNALRSKIKNIDSFKVGYAGSIGIANHLEVLIEAANKLQNVDFFIVGDGPEKIKLQRLIKYSNVHFLGRVPKKQVQSFLHEVDACYVGWSKTSLYQYGIGANKIADYLYSGKAILHSYSGEADPIKAFDAGLSFEAENVNKLVEGIENLISNPVMAKQFSENARNTADTIFDYKKIAKKLSDRIQQDLG